MARRIEVEIIGDSRKLEQAFARSERSAKRFDQQMGRTSRGASASFQTMAIGWQTALAGGALLLGKQFVEASRNAEVILGQTKVALSDAGMSWERYGKTIEDASTRISERSAFDDEAVLQSFQVFVRGQKDVEKSLRLTQLAADVARGRYIELDQATQLVNKAAMGQVGALRRAGIQIDKNATSAQALDALLKAYSGSAATYADSAAGSADKLRVAWENLSEQAGGPLSDSLAEVAGLLTVIVKRMQQIKSLGGTGGGLTKFVTTSLPGQLKMLTDNWDRLMRDLNIGQGGGGDFATKGGDTGGGGNFFKTPSGRSPFDAARAAKAGQQGIDDLMGIATKWLAAGKRYDTAQKAWQRMQDRQRIAAERYQTRKDTRFGWLEFGLERAEATKKLSDDRTWLRKRETYIQQLIKHEGRTLELVRDLWETRQRLRDLNKKQAKDGDPLAGLMQVSTKQLTNILAAGTGLTAQGRGRLAYNIAAQEPTVVHSHVYIDGVQVASAVNRHNAKGGRRTAAQTSGRRG